MSRPFTGKSQKTKRQLLIIFYVQDLPSKPKYLVTFTVGVKQKRNIDAAVKKVYQSVLLS